ncbi:MAG: TonB-dependent receptor plug domain-containing protein [Bacteroidota bacterium]
MIVGYTAQSRRNVTGAVTSVDVDEVMQIPSTNISETLQGRVPGITIGQEGGPGGGTMVRIRGFGTIGNNQPLFVIDGVPTRGNLNDINPNDIESIQVLKDASSASIYGSRAGNGVVIVTTKKGKLNQPTLDFNSYYGIQSLTSALPEVLNAEQFADMLWQAQINDGQNPSHPHIPI